jgi:hypothetical protein
MLYESYKRGTGSNAASLGEGDSIPALVLTEKNPVLSPKQFNEHLTLLQTSLRGKEPFETLHSEVTRLPFGGVSQDEMMRLLLALHSGAADEFHDVIADVADLVWGFCRADLRIYPN